MVGRSDFSIRTYSPFPLTWQALRQTLGQSLSLTAARLLPPRLPLECRTAGKGQVGPFGPWDQHNKSVATRLSDLLFTSQRQCAPGQAQQVACQDFQSVNHALCAPMLATKLRTMAKRQFHTLPSERSELVLAIIFVAEPSLLEKQTCWGPGMMCEYMMSHTLYHVLFSIPIPISTSMSGSNIYVYSLYIVYIPISLSLYIYSLYPYL